MGVSHKPHEVDRKEKMLPELSEGPKQARLLMTTVLGEGPAE